MCTLDMFSSCVLTITLCSHHVFSSSPCVLMMCFLHIFSCLLISCSHHHPVFSSCVLIITLWLHHVFSSCVLIITLCVIIIAICCLCHHQNMLSSSCVLNCSYYHMFSSSPYGKIVAHSDTAAQLCLNLGNNLVFIVQCVSHTVIAAYVLYSRTYECTYQRQQ